MESLWRWVVWHKEELGIALGIVGTIGAAMKFIIAWYYENVLLDLENAKNKIINDSREAGLGQHILIPQDEIIKESGHSTWVVKRAKRWKRRKELRIS